MLSHTSVRILSPIQSMGQQKALKPAAHMMGYRYGFDLNHGREWWEWKGTYPLLLGKSDPGAAEQVDGDGEAFDWHDCSVAGGHARGAHTEGYSWPNVLD